MTKATLRPWPKSGLHQPSGAALLGHRVPAAHRVWQQRRLGKGLSCACSFAVGHSASSSALWSSAPDPIVAPLFQRISKGFMRCGVLRPIVVLLFQCISRGFMQHRAPSLVAPLFTGLHAVRGVRADRHAALPVHRAGLHAVRHVRAVHHAAPPVLCQCFAAQMGWGITLTHEGSDAICPRVSPHCAQACPAHTSS